MRAVLIYSHIAAVSRLETTHRRDASVCDSRTAPPAGTTKGYLRTCLTPSFSSETTEVIRASAQKKKSRLLLLSCFMSNLFPLIASLKTTRARAQRNYDESAAHGIWCLFHTKGVMAHSIWVFSNVKTGKGEKKKTLQKDKQRLYFKKTAVAGSGCVLPYSFRNNKHRLLTGRRRGGTAATRSARASQGSLKESGWRKRETPSENKHFSRDERCFFLPFSLSHFFLCDHFDDNGSFSLPRRESCAPSRRVIPRLFHYVFTPLPLPQSKHFVLLFA